MTENWRPVVGWESYYEVSDHGRVRRLCDGRNTVAGRILQVHFGSAPYPCVSLSQPGVKVVTKPVHTLVCAAFFGPRPVGHHTNHKDGNKQNNHISNLEYVTAGDNARHAVATGLNDVIGEGNSAAKLTEEQVLDIRRRYRPFTCTTTMLAKELAISKSQVCSALRGTSWAHLDEGSVPYAAISTWIVDILRDGGCLGYQSILAKLWDRGYKPRHEAVNQEAVIRTLVQRLVKSGLVRRLKRGLFEAAA